MKTARIVATIACAALYLAFAPLAEARPTLYLDLGSGVSVPVAGHNWHHRFEASYKFVFRAGIEFTVAHGRVTLGPELGVEVVAENPRNTTYSDKGISADFTSTRATIGGRLGVLFPHGAVFVRAGVGLDYLGGWDRQPGEPRRYLNGLSTAFGASVGICLFPIKNLSLGVWTGPTIAGYDLGDGQGKFTSVDVDTVFTIGGRL